MIYFKTLEDKTHFYMNDVLRTFSQSIAMTLLITQKASIKSKSKTLRQKFYYDCVTHSYILF